jgi:hypothetical protein
LIPHHILEDLLIAVAERGRRGLEEGEAARSGDGDLRDAVVSEGPETAVDAGVIRWARDVVDPVGDPRDELDHRQVDRGQLIVLASSSVLISVERNGAEFRPCLT